MGEGHSDDIMSHITRGLTTASMGGLNKLFSTEKRKACGNRTVEYLTIMLEITPGNLLYCVDSTLKLARSQSVLRIKYG
jgi:hypothetical protein